MSTSLGRLSAAEAAQPAKYDAPEKTVSAILSNQDAIIAAIKALCAKLDADAGVTDANYASSVSDALAAIDLSL
jgi:hypothetical protein